MCALISRRVPYIPQMEMTECGAASLAMVLAYHGHCAPLPEVRVACGVSRDGANARMLVLAAKNYALEAKGLKAELDQMDQLPLPAILHWDFNHFVVLESLGRRGALIVDPAFGRCRVSIAELGRRFTGVALIFKPAEGFQLRADERPSLTKYRDLIREYAPSLVQLLLASLALQVLGLGFPIANQLLLDRVILPKQETWLWGLAFGLGAFTLAKAALTLVRSWVLQGLQNVLDLTLMQRFFDHLLHLPLGFFLHREAGDLAQRVQSNTTLRNLLGSQSLSAILDVFLLMGYAGLMLLFSFWLGLLVLALGAVRASALYALRNKNQMIMASELAAAGREGGALVEALTGFETTKASAAEARMHLRWSHRMIARVNHSLERRRLNVNVNQLLVFLQGCTLAAVFYVGGREVIAQRMTLGVFAAFLALQGLFMVPLGTLLEAAAQLQYLSNHLRRLDDVLETRVEPSGAADPGRLKGNIELCGVSFTYSPGAPLVVQGLDVQIRPGEKIALVGPTGAGKSTVARLLLGMHLPTEGVIRFDGRDLRELDLQKLRNQMGVVLQDAFLFDDTVRANLSLNDESIPLERLKWAARMACVEDVIQALPQGYETRVGEDGSQLSGGQRQRLNLARALAHDPAVLLLDEATSSLDLDTERRLHGNLAKLGCTRILIAHRLATVQDADRILVLQAGRIVQQGTYAELAARPGLFQELIQARELCHG